MTDRQTYIGGCHCGAVRYRATTDLTQLFDCNCSRCRRVAAVMTALPASDFVLERGEDAVTRYQFNHHVIDHYFCTTCGIQSFSRGKNADGSATVVINVGCLEGVPLVDRTKITHFDGASF